MIIKKINLAILSAFICYAPLGYTAANTVAGNKDPHIQSINYDENVYKFYSAEGIVTTIEFDKKEIIKDFAMGDKAAWTVAKSGNLLVIKPNQPKGSTNLTVYTDKQAYLFWVEMLKKNNDKVVYWLKVRSPNQVANVVGGKSPEQLEAEAQAAKIAAREAEIEQIKKDLKNSKNEGKRNENYTIVGAPELQPLAAYDNGQLTYLTFSAANPLPAPFIVEADGTESIVDSHMEGDTMVLHRVVNKIALRRGRLIAGITNHNVKLNGMSSPTGTVSDNVDRVIKGKE